MFRTGIYWFDMTMCVIQGLFIVWIIGYSLYKHYTYRIYKGK